LVVAKILNILTQMRQNPKGVAYGDLCKVCDHYFGEPRQSSSSHRIYKTPWQGDPRVNIQNDKGMGHGPRALAIERLAQEDTE
jgi:hypothetical protein